MLTEWFVPISVQLPEEFVEIGSQPATSYVKDLVDFNKSDEIKVEFETCQTKTTGLFAAGDLNTRVGHKLPDRGDEIGQLAADFDAMASRLQAMQQAKFENVAKL